MTRWCCPQRRTRFSSLVSPPAAQWMMWWAWHITGGLVQPGKAQCWSRQTTARQSGGVTSRCRRPTSRTSPLPPRATGMMSASQASRRTTAGASSRPSSVVDTLAAEGGPVDLLTQHVQGRGDGDPGPGAVAVRGQVGGQRVLAGLDEGVPHPGAVVPRVLHDLAVRVVDVHGRLRLGERQEGGLQQGGVLDGAAAPEPDAAGTVLGDGQVAAVVGGPVLPVQRLLGVPLRLVGVGQLDQALGGRRRGRWRSAGPPPRAAPPRHGRAPRRSGGACRRRSRSPRPAPVRPGRPASRRGWRSARRPGSGPAGRCGAPCRGWCPARWVNQSAVDPQASSFFGIWRASISASTTPRAPASWARRRLGLGRRRRPAPPTSWPPTASRPGRRGSAVRQPRPPRRGWSAFRSAAPWRYSTRAHRQCRPLTCGYPQNQTSFEKRFEDFTLAFGGADAAGARNRRTPSR